MEGPSHWKDRLKDKYRMEMMVNLDSMGRGKRRGKQKVSFKEEDISGLEDVLSSDTDDDTYEGASSDDETASPVRRPYRRGTRGTRKEIPLMEGEGRNLRVLGFSQRERAAFVKILRRFGTGKYDWAEFVPRLKNKAKEEIANYGTLFLKHVSEEITDSPTFSDGVPKEGLDVEDILVRIGQVSLIRDKVKALSEGSILFAEDIIARYPELKGRAHWKEHHDRVLLKAVMKHGYGRWQEIVDDEDLRLREVIFQGLNLPDINMPVLVIQRRQVEFIKKRVLLLEKGLNAELQKRYYADENANDVTNDEAGPSVPADE